MELLPAFAAYLAICGLAAYEAKRQGRFGVGILVFSIVLTPIVTLWYLVVTSDSKDYEEQSSGQSSPASLPPVTNDRVRERFRPGGSRVR